MLSPSYVNPSLCQFFKVIKKNKSILKNICCCSVAKSCLTVYIHIYIYIYIYKTHFDKRIWLFEILPEIPIYPSKAVFIQSTECLILFFILNFSEFTVHKQLQWVRTYHLWNKMVSSTSLFFFYIRQRKKVKSIAYFIQSYYIHITIFVLVFI